MSDSENADLPSEAVISRALRDIVITIHKSGKPQDLTVKRVRNRAEEALDLPADFLKSDVKWKQKSSDLIRDAVEKYCIDEPGPQLKKGLLKKKTKPKAAPKKLIEASDSPRGVKRKPAAPAKKPQKRRKTASSDDEIEAELSDVPSKNDAISDADDEPPEKPTRRRNNKVVTEESEDEDEDERHNEPKVLVKSRIEDEASKDSNDDADGPVPAKAERETPIVQAKGDVSESEMSSLIDESPVKSKRQKKGTLQKPEKGRKSGTAEAKAKPARAKQAHSDDPDQAEIKRLQGWLVKCGIRKVWSKELASFDTIKEKIKHLKNMLKDAGMDGRFSDEKAAKIKEEREFAKDLEAIQEGARSWGPAEVSETGRPRRRAAARAAPYVTVPPVKNDDDDDEEEEDQAEEQNDEDDESSAGMSSDGNSGGSGDDDEGGGVEDSD